MSVPHVQGAAYPALNSIVEEHLTSLIREALEVQRHSKRARIHLARNAPASEATSSRETPAKRRMNAEDINMTLQWRGSEKIYATATVGSSSRDDKRVNLADYIKSELELKPPQELGLSVHWLAIDGLQPDIPQNPSQMHTDVPSSHRIEDDESPDTTSSGEGLQVTQLMPRILSEELQLYFERVTNSIERGESTALNRQQQDAAIRSIAQDMGLQELVPFLVHYVSKSMLQHVGNALRSRTLVRMAWALLSNPNLHLELHLHQLLPSLLTCVVAERLSSKAWEDHWGLRRDAAMVLVKACNIFGEDYATLKARVLKTLCGATGTDRCLSTQYGGFVGISLFGPKAIDAFMLPIVLQYWQSWETTLEDTEDIAQRFELQMCQKAVLDALSIFFYDNNSETPSSLQIGWEALVDTFGDKLVGTFSQENNYYTMAIL